MPSMATTADCEGNNLGVEPRGIRRTCSVNRLDGIRLGGVVGTATPVCWVRPRQKLTHLTRAPERRHRGRTRPF
jgi:hypothetical protein